MLSLTEQEEIAKLEDLIYGLAARIKQNNRVIKELSDISLYLQKKLYIALDEQVKCEDQDLVGFVKNDLETQDDIYRDKLKTFIKKYQKPDEPFEFYKTMNERTAENKFLKEKKREFTKLLKKLQNI